MPSRQTAAGSDSARGLSLGMCAAGVHEADAQGSSTTATSSSVSPAATRRELRPEQRGQGSAAQAHGRHAGHRAHGVGHGSGSSSRRGPPPYVRTAPPPRTRDNGGGDEGDDEGEEDGEGTLAEFKESGTRTLGTRLQRDAFSAVMASQGIRTRAGLDKALSDVSEFLRTVPSDDYFRGEHDFDLGACRLCFARSCSAPARRDARHRLPA